MEPYDAEIEWALTHNIEPADHIAAMTRPEVKVFCLNCDHEISLHGDKYGCQYERGDKWVDFGNGDRLIAQGPCGCKDPVPVNL